MLKHGLPPIDQWLDKETKLAARAVPARLRELPTRQLGQTTPNG